MASDLDPNCPEMRAQRRALRGLDHISVSRKYLACELSERFGGTVEAWQVKISKAYKGKTRLSVGAYRVIEQSLDEEDRVIFARAVHADLDLMIDTANYDEPDDLPSAAVDTMKRAVEGLDAMVHGSASSSTYRALADAANTIAASLERSEAAANKAA